MPSTTKLTHKTITLLSSHQALECIPKLGETQATLVKYNIYLKLTNTINSMVVTMTLLEGIITYDTF
jgi:hypothetical protein